MNILSLDVGEYTGFATLIDGRIESGVEHLKKKGTESLGMKYLRFTDLLKRLDYIGNFNLIVYEKPHGLKGHAIEAMNGYITRIHEFIAIEDFNHRTIEYIGYPPTTIKKAITGNGRASKDDMINWFNGKVGRIPIDDNEADAYSLLIYTIKEFNLEDFVK